MLLVDVIYIYLGQFDNDFNWKIADTRESGPSYVLHRQVNHEITKLLSRASSLVTPWSAVGLLLPPKGYKLATSQDCIAVADELGTQH